jgi:dipeptidyl aminopeptidase/acylaminoacyl peptidase
MQHAPYGTWESPLSAADLARGAITLGYPRADNGRAWWVESRPTEGGRYVIATAVSGGPMQELTPAGFNVRSRVHEYGGLPYTPSAHGLFFCNFPDQRLYRQQAAGSAPVALTPEGYRYADLEPDPSGSHLYCVREDHTGGGEPRNAVVVVDTEGGEPGAVLFGDSDFVAYPRLSPDGKHLAWIAWNHPDMPWDATTLYVAVVQGDTLVDIQTVAGGPRESVLEPRWDSDGTLYFLSDAGGWWNLYRHREGVTTRVLAIEAELGGALWVLGQSTYALMGDGRAVVRYTTAATDRLGIVQLDSGQMTPLTLPHVSFSGLQRLTGDTVLAIAASPTEEAAIVEIRLDGSGYSTVRAPAELKLNPAGISVAEPIEFPTTDGLTAHAFYYPPAHAGNQGLVDEKPPLIVRVHGGPTSHVKPELSPAIQYWTSRGFALLDVNYGGSTGYGRAYRERLNGSWGVVDVADAVAAVKHLVATGRVDERRAAIRGGSAGGFTVLACLAFHDVFRAGANYYGVSDLEALAHDTHKFESRYLDRLVAPLPEGRPVYEARAPIKHLEGFRAPLITFQGAEDRVVPPEQSRSIVAALQARGIPVVYIELEGEQHGFRKAESLVRTLESELAFYGQVFGFKPAGDLPPLTLT